MVANTLAVMTVEISISCVVKVYHHCSFKVKEEDRESVFRFQEEGRTR